ncbi:MAG TPA: hypothetical protein VFG52_09335 [Xanthomonadales bacterium]|nr:hypothetical protein [Xanthomonadales bacterium]
MTDFPATVRTTARMLVPALMLLSLSACREAEEFDYCKNHYEVHAEHADSIGRIDANVDAAGLLSLKLELPAAVFPAGSAGPDADLLAGMLSKPELVYTLDSAQPCSTPTVQVLEASYGVAIEYQSDCGVGNRISQVNVELFELIDGLEEVEVQVKTPATGKHFAISRMCERAIFRLALPH